MNDLISRQAAIEAVHKSIFDFFDICDDDEESPMTYKDKLLLEVNKAITTQIKAVASAESIKASPVKHGRWIKEWSLIFHTELTACSECGRFSASEWHYCPNCGARMDKVEWND